jgi:hypothetical protein
MRDSALLAQRDLAQVRADLGALSGRSSAAATASPVDVNELVRDAARSAGAADALAGIEPGRPNDLGQVPVIVGFTPLSLQQLVSFIHTLASGPAMAHSEAIELSASESSGGAERWTATVTISVRSSR